MNASNSRYHNVSPVSWEQLHGDARSLAWRLLDHGPFAGIVAITRGGLVPAAVISRELCIRHVETVCLSSYDWQEQGEPRVLKPVDHSGEGLLLLDDLVDTGQTAGLARQMLPGAFFATLYAKPAGRPLVDMYITEVPQDTWVLFPWDSGPCFTEPIIEQRKRAP